MIVKTDGSFAALPIVIGWRGLDYFLLHYDLLSWCPPITRTHTLSHTWAIRYYHHPVAGCRSLRNWGIDEESAPSPRRNDPGAGTPQLVRWDAGEGGAWSRWSGCGLAGTTAPRVCRFRYEDISFLQWKDTLMESKINQLTLTLLLWGASSEGTSLISC